MKLRIGFLLRVSIIMLVILAVLLVYWLLWIPFRVSSLGPSITSSIELLIIVVLYISISCWIAFVDKEVKSWEKSLLLIGMILGLLLFLFLGLFSAIDLGLDSPGFLQANPDVVNNLTLTTNFMFIIAAILLVAILGFTLIPRRKSIVEWMKTL